MRAARIYSHAPLCSARAPIPPLGLRSFPAPCAARCCSRVAAKIPLQPRRLAPCTAPRSALVPSVLHATVGPWPSLPQSSLYSPLQPFIVAYRRTCSQGFGASCLRAPGLRLAVRDRHAPCTYGLLLASLRGHSTADDVGCSFPCRSASTAPHMHHADHCEAQRPRRASTHRTGKGSRRSLLGRSLAPRAATPAIVAQGPGAAAVARALVRLRSPACR